MYNALIRTHHITSRKKVAVLKAAAKELQCYALLRTGGTPGVMFVQGNSQDRVQRWVETVRNLHYMGYQLASPAAAAARGFGPSNYGSLVEVSTVKDMAAKMNSCDLADWWRKAMGFTNE